MKVADKKLKKTDELKYAHLTVPVWQVVEGTENAYLGQFVRDEDLPGDLRQVFSKSQFLAQVPFTDASYLHDFTGFMNRGGKGWGYDFSEVVRPYIKD